MAARGCLIAATPCSTPLTDAPSAADGEMVLLMALPPVVADLDLALVLEQDLLLDPVVERTLLLA